MNFDKIKRKAQTTRDELEGVLREHAELARRQYDEISERHGDPVERVEEAVREPLEDTREQVEELSQQVNQQTEDLALEVAQRTDHIGRLVNTEAERWGRELDKRTAEVRELVRERLGFEPRVRTRPISEDETSAGPEEASQEPPTPPREDVQDSSQAEDVAEGSESTDELGKE